MIDSIRLISGDDYELIYEATVTTSERPEPHTEQFVVPLLAIANRWEFYGAAGVEKALEHIFEEHDSRLNGHSGKRPVLDKSDRLVESWDQISVEDRKTINGAHLTGKVAPPPLGERARLVVNAHYARLSKARRQTAATDATGDSGPGIWSLDQYES